MPDILHEVVIESTPDKVYKALTEQGGLASWWTTNVKAQPKEGTTSEFGFSNPAFTIKLDVKKLNPPQYVEWTMKQGAPDWQGTRVTWDIAAADNGTKLLMGHRGYASTEGSFARTSYNWAWFLTSLKTYLETGKGTPVS